MVRPSLDGIQQLGASKRIQLAEQTWDSIAAAPDVSPISESRIHELDRQLKLHNEDPGAAQAGSTIRSRPTESE